MKIYNDNGKIMYLHMRKPTEITPCNITVILYNT